MQLLSFQNNEQPIINAKQLNALLDVQKSVIAPNADIESVMSAVVNASLDVVQSADGAIVELREGEDMVYRAASGILKDMVGSRIKISGSLAGLCLSTGETQYCPDTESDTRVNRIACRRASIRSMVIVPIFHRTSIVGVLKVYSTMPNAFSEDEQLVVQFFVNMISAGFGSIAEYKALEDLRESEARFERAIRGSNDGIWDWDLKGQKIYYSPRFKELLGYDEHELGNRIEEWAGILHVDDYDRVMKVLEAHLCGQGPYVIEYRLRSKSGEYLWFEARGQAQWDEIGQPTRMSGCLTDISARRQLESIKKEFIYTVTHELRSPLTALKGALDIMSLMHKVTMPEPAQNMLDLALKGSDRLMLLLDDLLDVGKMEAGQMSFKMQKTQLSEVLHDSVESMKTYAGKNGVSFVLEEISPKVKVDVDKDRLMQVMANLLSNAAKYSPEGSAVLIGAHVTGDKVVISVKDNGTGIPEKFQARIFEKFSQGGKKHGTGLGLNISKTMVEKMNGKIWFKSAEEIGTVFYVEFPLA